MVHIFTTCRFSRFCKKLSSINRFSASFTSQVRIDRRPTVGPTLIKLVQPCWPEVGPTSQMITLSVHWRELKYACTRVENEIRAVAGPDKVHYLINTLLVRYWCIICNRTLQLKISYSLLDSNPLTLLMSNLFVSGISISYGFKIFTLSMTELNFYKTQYFCMKLGKNFFIKNI